MCMDRQLLSSEGVHQEGKGRVDARFIRDPALDPDIQLPAVPGVCTYQFDRHGVGGS